MDSDDKMFAIIGAAFFTAMSVFSICKHLETKTYIENGYVQDDNNKWEKGDK